MTDDGRTIYGFIQGEKQGPFDQTGIDGRELYTLSFEGISALVSDLPQKGFDNLPKEALLRNLTVYQSVIENVMMNHSIIPVKFGTLLDGDAAVVRVLKYGKERIDQSLKDMGNKIELDVVVLWPDLNIIMTEIGEMDEIKVLKENTAEQSENDILEMKINAGKKVKALLEQKRKSLQSIIMPPLLDMAEKHCIHALMDDSMILNAAFLIKKIDAARMEGVVAGLDRHFEDQINFRIIGPLPPYSFRTFEVKTVNYEQLNTARKLLQLEEEATQQEIRDHYWQLTKKCHPDKFPDDPDAQKHYEKINHAYRLVTEYCRELSCSFREKAIKNWVDIRAVGN